MSDEKQGADAKIPSGSPGTPLALLRQITSSAMALGASSLSVGLNIPATTSTARPATASVGLTYVGQPQAGVTVGKLDDILGTLDTAILEGATTLSETLLVEGGYSCSVSLARC